MGGTCRNSSDPAVVRLACSPKLDRDDQAYSEPAMRTVNMQVAKTNLSRLVEAAANGEPFIIARAGKPMVKVVAIDAPTDRAARDSWPDRSPCRATSTGWDRTRSGPCSRAASEGRAGGC